MAGKCKLPALVLSAEERQRLERLSASRVAPLREVERARILWRYQAGDNPSAIQRALKISRVTIYHCLHKALEMGLEAGLKDAFHRPREPVIGPGEKAWVVQVACTKPQGTGLRRGTVDAPSVGDARAPARGSGRPPEPGACGQGHRAKNFGRAAPAPP